MRNFHGNVCQQCGLYISSSTRFCPRCKKYCVNITEDEEEYDFYYNPPFESNDYSKGYHDPDDYVTRHYDYDDYGDEDDEPTEMEEWVMHEWEIDNVDDGR